MLRFLLLVLLALFLGTSAMGGGARDALLGNQQTGVSSKDVIPGVVVVKLKHSNSVAKTAAVPGDASSLLQAFAQCGVTSLAPAFPTTVPMSDAAVAEGRIDVSQMYFAAIPSSMNPVEVAAQLAALPEVEYAEPKYYSYLCDVPNDSDYVATQQVYFNRMKVAEGWTVQKGSADVVIATVDGGTNWQHEDLAANLWINPLEDINHNGRFDPGPPPQGDNDGIDQDGNGKVDDVIGWNFATNANNPRGSQATPGNADHGTETASEFGAVANNGRGMAGTSWNCRLMPVCAADPKVDLSIPYGFEGIEYASRMGARVINCSWYRAGGWGNYSQWEQDVITATTQRGALIVAAAGNNHLQNLDDSPYYPASYDHVLSVGATTDTSDEIAYFTNMGLNVSVFAPGMRIHVAKDNGSYGTDQGTSHSSPLVAGLAGLLFAKHPDWTPDQVAEQIRITSDPIDGSNPTWAGSLGHGRVNFFRALTELHSGIVVVSGHFHSLSGRPFFQEGDTVILSVKVKNVLNLAAQNLSFNVSVDPGLVPLAPIPGPTRLDAGAEDSLDCYFVPGALAEEREVNVRLSWSANADERDAHMFKTTVYGGRGFWERQKSPTAIPLWSVHAVSSSVVWAAGAINTSNYFSVLRTIDGGENWVCVNGDLSGICPTCVFAVDSLHAWVGGMWGKISATTDGGVSWRHQNYPSPGSSFIKGFRFFDAANGYAFGDPGTSTKFVILQTTNGGGTWTHFANEPVGVAGAWEVIEFCCTDRQHIWFGAPPSLVWRTTDGGSTWSSVTVGKKQVAALAMRDDSVGLMCTGVGIQGSPTSLYRTTDGGATWQPLQGVKPDGGYCAAAFPAGSTNAWVAGIYTVACSRDNGVTWALQPIEPISSHLRAISFCDSANGWMVTQAGEILRYRDRTGTTTVPIERGATLPVQVLLHQNFPNPFNPSTTIRYELPKSSMVKLSVYDMLGREVSVLVNEKRDAGIHEVKFDGSSLASGVYFYRLQAGDYTQTRKLCLIR